MPSSKNYKQKREIDPSFTKYNSVSKTVVVLFDAKFLKKQGEDEEGEDKWVEDDINNEFVAAWLKSQFDKQFSRRLFYGIFIHGPDPSSECPLYGKEWGGVLDTVFNMESKTLSVTLKPPKNSSHRDILKTIDCLTTSDAIALSLLEIGVPFHYKETNAEYDLELHKTKVEICSQYKSPSHQSPGSSVLPSPPHKSLSRSPQPERPSPTQYKRGALRERRNRFLRSDSCSSSQIRHSHAMLI